MTNSYIHRFNSAIEESLIPDTLNNPFQSDVPQIAKLAASELQMILNMPESTLNSKKFNTVKGKMFGVLVVIDDQDGVGYLAAYSGKTTQPEVDSFFVPSVFNNAFGDFFIDKGMTDLSQISNEIKSLMNNPSEESAKIIAELKLQRTAKSKKLQNELFSHYQFCNKLKEYKKLTAIFETSANKTPPAAAGECAAPKLLNFAFENNLKPIAIAEFWWGSSNPSMSRKHGHFYPACNDKCLPILTFMLSD